MAYPELDAVLIRKHFVRSMNYFDQRFGHYWADADLAMQIRRAGKQIRLFPGVRATYHAAPDPLEGDALANADRVSGAAALVGKYEGGGAAFSFRLGAVLVGAGSFRPRNGRQAHRRAKAGRVTSGLASIITSIRLLRVLP